MTTRLQPLFFIILSLITIFDLNAKKIDTSIYEFTYDVKSKPEKNLDYYEQNIYTLQIGTSSSKFYSKRFERKREVTDSILSNHGNQQDQFIIFSKEDLWEVKPNYEIFKVFKEKPYLIWTEYLGSHYKSKDNIPNIKWNVLPGDSIICEQQCKKAVGTYRGVQWEIWFAPEIPIDNGPWKLGGAPGLILKAQDSNRYFTFECIGIKKNSEDIVYHDEWDYEERKPHELSTFIKKWKNNQAGMIEAISGTELPAEVRNQINRKKQLTDIEIFKK